MKRRLWQQRNGESMWVLDWIMSQQYALVTKDNHILGHIRQRTVSRSREVILPICSTEAMPTKEMELQERIQHRIIKLIKGLEHLTYEERLTIFRRSFRKILPSITTWKEGTNKTEPGSSLVPRARIRDNGHTLEYKRFHRNIKKHFTACVGEHWNNLPREVVESPPWRSSKAI